jgi:hypothetical protein
MKIIYTQEINNCDFELRTLETEKVIRTSGEFVGKDKKGQLVHVDIDRIVKIES